MKVHFQINYCTVWGEEVRVHLLQSGRMDIIFPLSTTDGKSWAGEMMVSGDITYQYYIYYNGQLTRTEWNVNQRYVVDDGHNRSLILVDSWRNKSDLACFYSSAFTDCIRYDDRHSSTDDVETCTLYDESLILNVMAPQMESGQTLYISGNQDALGNWNPDEAVAMSKSNSLLQWSILLDASKLVFPIDFKFFIRHTDEAKTIEWENSNNHTLNLCEIQHNEVHVYSDISVYFARPLWKGAGVAIPVFSLRTKNSFGVGDFGDLKKMIDWVTLTHQRVLQLLPLNDTTITHSWTDSYPYSSISIYALHPMYIDIKALGSLKDKIKAHHFEALQRELNALSQIDYEKVNNAKWEYIQLMFEQEGDKVLGSKDFKDFFAANDFWLMPYAAFSYLRDKFGTPDFRQWKDDAVYDKDRISKLCSVSNPEYPQIAVYYYAQYNLHLQLSEASHYARSHRVVLKGDIPIGISRNSVEAWTEPYYFNMNGQAGAPPDDFSVKGQNWGFPTYNWGEMAKDGYRWWKDRFTRMAQYFDAYRIDHILGFFRIWEIPSNAVHGLLGQFSPSIAMSIEEIQRYGLYFRHDLFIKPYITDGVVDRIFGEHAAMVKVTYLNRSHDDMYDMKSEYDTQRKVESAFAGKDNQEDIWIRDGLYALISDVLFVPDRKDEHKFHPRIAVQFDFVYEVLNWHEKEAFNRLYNDYYYRRHNHFWYGEAMKKLPQLIGATRMLVCGEDLGMVPDCVETVMNELHILSLELQRMPKRPENEFGHPSDYPYYSVCTFSSHDTSTLRGWWKEDLGKTARFFYDQLHQQGDLPTDAPAWACEMVVNQQLNSSSMLCILSFQDWLSIDDAVRNPDVDGERINVPANPKHYWRYRIHLPLEELIENKQLNDKIIRLIDSCGRYMM